MSSPITINDGLPFLIAEYQSALRVEGKKHRLFSLGNFFPEASNDATIKRDHATMCAKDVL